MAMLMMKKTRMVPFLTCWLLVISQVHTDQDIGDSLSWSEEEVAVVESCRQEAASLEERMRIADSFTHQGNQLSAQGMHHHAVLKWEIATTCDNRSNVPWNNMANSFFAMGNLSAATAAAEISFSIKADHMSSTTLGNAYRAHKMYERAEKTFLAGIKYCLDNKDRHEHPFWSLAMLYWDQGDYIEFLKYSKLGLDHLSRPECVETAEEQVPCHIPDFEIDLMTRVYEASVDLGKFLASHGRYQEAETNLEWAEYVAETYPAERLDVQLVRKHLTCLKCAADNTQHRSPCDSDLDACRASWRDTNGRYLRMMAVRAMGCEWRHREEDVRDLERIMMSPNMTALLNHTTEFYFECEKGRVCGAGAQPPLHMWGLPMSLESVLVMGKVQPLQLVDRMLVDGPPPQWAYPTWNPSIGTVLRIGLLSSDLLRDHPVGNMMRHVLHLHDLSRMDVTVFLVHESQRYAASRVENEHVLGEVKFRMIGRGPHVTRFFDAQESVEGADIVNSAGICILFDLIGYTADHRQDIFALRPAPVQVHYHGYMGSTGAPWIQSYVADRWIAPPEHANFFSEKLALMPECFLGPSHRLSFQFAGNEERDFSEKLHTELRKEEGLPPEGPVICYFNQHFKLDPPTFKIWTDAIQKLVSFNSSAHPTLWLLQGSPISHRNLKREFQSAGLPGENLVIAKRVLVKTHIRRASLCDLAVDTPMYNSGATGADTLYAAVPLLHIPGLKAVGRMMSAMLQATRVKELIVRDDEEYQELIVRLLKNFRGRHHDGDSKLERLRRKFRRGILWGPIFDIAKWVADFEQLSRMMWEVHVFGYDMMHIVPVRPTSFY